MALIDSPNWQNLVAKVERIERNLLSIPKSTSVQIYNLDPLNKIIKGDIRPNKWIVCFCDATDEAFTVDLPDAGQRFETNLFSFIKIDSSGNAVTQQAQFDQLINGALTNVLSSQYDKIIIASNSLNWFKLS